MLHPAGIFGLCSSWVLLYSLPLVYVPSWVYSVFLVYCYISSILLDPLVYVLLFYDPSCCIVCLFGLCYVLFMFHLAGILSWGYILSFWVLWFMSGSFALHPAGFMLHLGFYSIPYPPLSCRFRLFCVIGYFWFCWNILHLVYVQSCMYLFISSIVYWHYVIYLAYPSFCYLILTLSFGYISWLVLLCCLSLKLVLLIAGLGLVTNFFFWDPIDENSLQNILETLSWDLLQVFSQTFYFLVIPVGNILQKNDKLWKYFLSLLI